MHSKSFFGGPRGLLALLVALLIFGSLLPQAAKHAIGTQGPWHRPLHMLLFAAIAALSRFALPGRSAWRGILALTALGLALEYAEHAVFHNLFEWRDVRDDLLGIAIGTCVALCVASRKEPA